MKTWREFLCGVLLTLVLVLCVGHSGGVNNLFRFREWRDNASVGRVWTCTNATDGSGCYSNIPSSTAPTNFWTPLSQPAPVSAAGGTETMMYSNFLAANTVGVNGSVWRLTHAFDKGGTAAATARVRLYIGTTTASTMYFDTENPNVAASPDFEILSEVWRTADATETISVKMFCDSVGAYTNLYTIDATLGYSWTSDLVVFATGVVTGGDSLTGRFCTTDRRPAGP